MNEELKLSALSSGLAPGKNEQQDASYRSAGDLNDFLLRRQLLTMESKRIQELIVEAEAEVKGKQELIVGLRDRVLASLSEHLALREQALREERALRQSRERKQTLRDLAKTAERYVRGKGKRLFAKSKSTPVAVTVSSDAIRGPDSGWHLPKVRELDSWAEWFAETNSTSRKSSRSRRDRIQVAFVVSGGIGDLLKSTHLVAPLSDHFSCDLTIIAAQRAVAEVVAQNHYVTDSMVPVSHHVFRFIDGLRHIPVFDLIVVWKYQIEYVRPPGSRIALENIQLLVSKSSDLRQALEKYCFLHGWPRFNFAFSRETTRFGLSAMSVGTTTSGLTHRNLDEIPFFPSKRSLRVVAELLTRRYVTVHHGFDLNFLPAKTRETGYSSTKNLSTAQWRQIVSLIRMEGVEVIQLGVVEEEKIEGVTHYLNGQTSLEETALLIKHSLCHIDTEGGLVHLATAVHSRCVVAFGPTPVEFFGYPQNINLEPSACKTCWFVTKTWLVECPRHTSGPECMRGHSAASVVEAAKRIIAESENLSAKLIAAETRFSHTPLSETVARAETLLSHDAESRILLIFDELRREIESALPDSVLERSDVILCSETPPGFEPDDRVAKRLEYGSLLNLPRASSSVNVVLWVSRELELDIAPFALREILRVLKPGGQLVFAAVGESKGLDLSRSLLAAQIAFNEDEMPSAAVYSCSLRKNGAQAADVRPLSRSAAPARGPETAQGHGNPVDPRLTLVEEENTRQISVARDLYAQWHKLIDEAQAVIDGAVQGGFGQDGWIWISNRFAEGYTTRFFMSGWHPALHYVIWSRENKCRLMLPLPAEQTARDHAVELQLHLTLPETSASNPMTIGVRVDDGPVENFRLSTNDEILKVQFSTTSSKFRGISLVEFRLGAEAGEGDSTEGDGDMAIGVRRFRYRVLSSQRTSPAP